MKTTLPIDLFISEIVAELNRSQNLVLSASPGAGKTTRLPPELLNITRKKILVLEPRRLAAVAAAQRICEEKSWKLGEEVGYQVRFENLSSNDTRLIFLTEALLARKIFQDPNLEEVGLVILDEFHERSIHTDLALSLLKELQLLSRPDLKILVMSATLEAEKIALFLNSKVIKIPGKQFPLEIIYQKESQQRGINDLFFKQVVEKIHLALKKTERHILVFLPGLGEIEKTKFHLIKSLSPETATIHFLHGQISLSEQRELLQDIKNQKQKIILATNIAESSITIDGLDTIVDCGLHKVMKMNYKTNYQELELSRISKASAQQRAGRAARQYSGTVYRLWNKMDELSMKEFDAPEINRTDLCETSLLLASQGIKNIRQFSWFEAPPEEAFAYAETLLKLLRMIEANHELTPLGRLSLKFPLHPRFSKFLIEASAIGWSDFGAEICALLQEKDPFFAQEAPVYFENDLLWRWEEWQGNKLNPKYKLINQSADQLKKLLHHFLKESSLKNKSRVFKLSSEEFKTSQFQLTFQKLLLRSFPDRLCRRRKINEPKGINLQGRGVVLSKTSSVKKSDFFIALQGIDHKQSETTISMAVSIDKVTIENEFSDFIKTKSEIFFDEETEKFLHQSYRVLENLAIDNPSLHPLDPDQLSELIPSLLIKKWEEVLRLNEELKNWFIRLQFFQDKQFNLLNNGEKLNNFSEEKKEQALREASFGETNIKVVMEKNLVYFFESQLEEKLLKEFQSSCPTSILLPQGKNVKIHYTADKNPWIEARIQDFFGLKKTPTIMNGTTKITLHLLGPNFRPLQITDDIESFWQTTYPQLRNVLKARYPKHKWPEQV